MGSTMASPSGDGTTGSRPRPTTQATTIRPRAGPPTRTGPRRLRLVPGSARLPTRRRSGRRRPRRAPARRRRRWRPGSATPVAGARDAWDGPRISTARASDAGRSPGRGRSPRQRTRRVEKSGAPSGRADGAREEAGLDGGPDRIRTGDLQRDRLACWAATPRVRSRWRMIAGTPCRRHTPPGLAKRPGPGLIGRRRRHPGWVMQAGSPSLYSATSRAAQPRRRATREVPMTMPTGAPVAATA